MHQNFTIYGQHCGLFVFVALIPAAKLQSVMLTHSLHSLFCRTQKSYNCNAGFAGQYICVFFIAAVFDTMNSQPAQSNHTFLHKEPLLWSLSTVFLVIMLFEILSN
jgi:hypothetical protein